MFAKHYPLHDKLILYESLSLILKMKEYFTAYEITASWSLNSSKNNNVKKNKMNFA